MASPCSPAGLDEVSSSSQRIGTELDFDDLRKSSLATFVVKGSLVAERRPQSASLPAGGSIIDAPIETFGKETHRTWNAEFDELAVHECLERVGLVACGDRDVLSEDTNIVLATQVM
jgi:hypothetical protein